MFFVFHNFPFSDGNFENRNMPFDVVLHSLQHCRTSQSSIRDKKQSFARKTLFEEFSGGFFTIFRYEFSKTKYAIRRRIPCSISNDFFFSENFPEKSENGRKIFSEKSNFHHSAAIFLKRKTLYSVFFS
jgi:hypothetical protein